MSEEEQKMRKFFTLAMLTAVALGVSLAASTQTQEMAKPEPHWASGTISAWDETAKALKVKEEGGKEIELAWNADTKVHGTPKVGEIVKVKYKNDKDGKAWATHIYAGKDEIEKADKKPH